MRSLTLRLLPDSRPLSLPTPTPSTASKSRLRSVDYALSNPFHIPAVVLLVAAAALAASLVVVSRPVEAAAALWAVALAPPRRTLERGNRTITSPGHFCCSLQEKASFPFPTSEMAESLMTDGFTHVLYPPFSACPKSYASPFRQKFGRLHLHAMAPESLA